MSCPATGVSEISSLKPEIRCGQDAPSGGRYVSARFAVRSEASHVIEQMISQGPPIGWIVLALAVAVLINVVMLRVAGRWVTGLDVGFGTALGAALLTRSCCFVLLVIFAFALDHVNQIVAQIAVLIVPPFVPLAVQLMVIRWRLDVTIVGAMLITLVMMALGAAIAIFLMAIFVVVFLLGGPVELPIELPAALPGAGLLLR